MLCLGNDVGRCADSADPGLLGLQAEALTEVLRALAAGRAPTPQDHQVLSQASDLPKLLDRILTGARDAQPMQQQQQQQQQSPRPQQQQSQQCMPQWTSQRSQDDGAASTTSSDWREQPEDWFSRKQKGTIPVSSEVVRAEPPVVPQQQKLETAIPVQQQQELYDGGNDGGNDDDWRSQPDDWLARRPSRPSMKSIVQAAMSTTFAASTSPQRTTLPAAEPAIDPAGPPSSSASTEQGDLPSWKRLLLLEKVRARAEYAEVA